MKRKRRYKEPRTHLDSWRTPGGRVHDFMKGWGTVAKDGSGILWDWWRPITKKALAKQRRRWKINPPFSKIVTPIINKDMSALQNYNYDIRQILIGNSMKDEIPTDFVITNS